MHARAYPHTYTYAHAHMHKQTLTHICPQVHTHIHVHMHTHTHRHTDRLINTLCMKKVYLRHLRYEFPMEACGFRPQYKVYIRTTRTTSRKIFHFAIILFMVQIDKIIQFSYRLIEIMMNGSYHPYRSFLLKLKAIIIEISL